MTATTDTDDPWAGAGPGPRRLLEAALAAFAARGYHGASTRDIAAAAGMSPAGVYAHHRTKADLLFAISEAGHRHVLAVCERAVSEEAGALARVRALVHDYAAWHARHHLLARVVQYEMDALLPEHRSVVVELRRRTERLFRQEIQDGVDTGAFDTPDVGSATLAALSLGIDVSRWYAPGGSRTPVGIGRAYAGLVLAMLGAGPPATGPGGRVP
ncbi:TetR/AcrR family transcriptional regulator [Streptomyces sp. NPDC017979]|uniref:TetR/AcrR family transcriptional regulator n=1 Tax=Streptomyces sp. NPDC017979 TaxID=3365024 RepID=UPI0037A3C35A